MRIGFIVMLALLGCGPAAGGDDDGPTTGGDDDDSSTDPDTSASATDTSASASSTSAADSTGEPSCEVYRTQGEIAPAVTITVRNESSAPIYFMPHGCGGAFAFDITTSLNEPVPYLLDSECTPNTCAGFVDSSDCIRACNDCGVPSAGRVEPGGTGEATWPGHILTELELQGECVPADGCPATCVRPDQAPTDEYNVDFTVYRTCTGNCECDGPSPGVCPLWNGEQLADPGTRFTTIDYPTQTTAEIVITD
jgi:hypothetical protein